MEQDSPLYKFFQEILKLAEKRGFQIHEASLSRIDHLVTLRLQDPPQSPEKN